MFIKPENNFDFIAMEKKWLEKWKEDNLTEKYIHKNDNSQEYFSFLDGPITANNPMGVHHAWGRTYKDLWQKFNNLLGKKQRFQNGFDCQGLWVEVEVEKELRIKNKKDIENLIPGNKKESIAKFVSLCKERVLKYASIQTDQSKRLGYLMDWEHSYFTMSEENNYTIWSFLKKCFEKGWVYKGNESVPWCPRCETAISQHEMLTEDYKEVVHESIYFELPLKNKKNEYLLVWTTTPWTLPANIAVAVDEKLEYSLIEGETGNKFWIAKELVEKVFKGKYKKTVKIVTGKELVGLHYESPFDDLEIVKKTADDNPNKFHVVVATDPKILPISIEEGTGMVHTAVSAGTEDFKLGKKLGLPMIPVIEDNADYLPGLGQFSGKNAKKNPRIILDYLLEKEKSGENWVFEIHKYKHRYPACWRCKTELVWKVAEEWYIAMDKPSQVESLKLKVESEKTNRKTLRESMIEVAKKIHWLPEFGLDRELDWLNNMHDWLISKKNRFWGLALPIYECKKCGNFEIIGSKKELKERSVSGWDKFEGHTPHKPYVDEVLINCKKCAGKVKRIEDVGNPWLDAGIVPYSTISRNNKGEPLYNQNTDEWRNWFPADFITESFPGQFKNWFYALIAESTVMENEPPFKTVLGFGTMLDENSKPFHKSAGNAIEFVEGADKFGADMIRWVCASNNPAENILFGENKVNDARRRFYLIFWNTYKFFLDYAELDCWNIAESVDLKKIPNKNILDRWILSRFLFLVENIKTQLSSYNSKDSSLESEKFLNDFSTWYIRRSRERVGANSDDKDDKNTLYSVIHYILSNFCIILSPFLPFITEEIYSNLTEKSSVHLSDYPKTDSSRIDEKLERDMSLIREFAEISHRARKELKIKLRQPLNNVTIYQPKEKKLFETKNMFQYQEILKNELNVKKVMFNDGELLKAEFDTKMTPKLILEGEIREAIRNIQNERKNLRLTMKDRIKLEMPEKFKDYADFIQKKVIADIIGYANEIRIVQ